MRIEQYIVWKATGHSEVEIEECKDYTENDASENMNEQDWKILGLTLRAG